jgi:hypothetical protein
LLFCRLSIFSSSEVGQVLILGLINGFRTSNVLEKIRLTEEAKNKE